MPDSGGMREGSRVNAGKRAVPVARPFLLVTLAFMAGLTAPPWGLTLPSSWLTASLALLFLALAALWLLGRNFGGLTLGFFFLLGTAFYQQALSPAFPGHHVSLLPQDREMRLLGRLDEPPRVQEGRMRLYVAVEAWQSQDVWRPATGRLLVAAPFPLSLPEGARVVLRVRLQPPRVLNNPGAFDRPRYLAAADIFQEARLRHPGDLVVLRTPDSDTVRDRLRTGMRLVLSSLPPLPQSLYLALILGDEGLITPAMWQAFSRTGTTHILSISGLHLGMVFGVGFLFFFWLLRRFPWLLLRLNAMKTATFLAVPPMAAYAWVAGGSPPTHRAEIMILAFLFLALLGRPREVVSALALAALLILTFSPLMLYTLSFQLSFLSVAGLIYFVPRWLGPPAEEVEEPGRVLFWGKRLGWWVKGALAASAAASLAAAPLVAAAFHQVSLLGVLVNLAAIPLMNTLAVPLGLLALAFQALGLPFAAQGLVAVGSYPLRTGYALVEWGAKLPGAAVILPSPSWLQIGLYFLVLVFLFPPRRSRLTWTGAALAGLVLAGTVAWPLARPPGVLEVTCLDSFRGLAAVAVTPDNRRLAVSAGGIVWTGREGTAFGSLPSYLHWRQYCRLDLVAALNLNQENAGELLTLCRQFDVGGVWFGERGKEGPTLWTLWNTLGDEGRPPRSLLRDRYPPTLLGNVDLAFPVMGNESGVGLRLTYRGRAILFVPPLKKDSLAEVGSGSWTSLEAVILPGDLLTAARLLWQGAPPRAVILYGFPSAAEQVLPERVYCTREGAVSLTLDEAGVQVSQWRRGTRRDLTPSP